MKLRDLVLLLPGYELDGFPRSLPAAEARDLLSGWIALWHPRLLAATAAAPRWHQASQLPGEMHEILFVLPEIARSEIQTDPAGSDIRQRIAAAGGSLHEPRQTTWRAFQAELLTAAEASGWLAPNQPEAFAENATASASDSGLVEELLLDFAALGYAFLQVQLMTRQLRYTSNLDLLVFGQQLTEAAEATLRGERATAERLLQSCFDSLGQERDHYYSLDVHLLDVTLLAPSTLGKSLEQQLAQANAATSPPTSFLASGQLLRTLHQAHPARVQPLQQALQDRRACLLGGLDVERPHPLMSREAIARDFARGRASYRQLGYEPPRVFARASFGLSPESVPMLRRWGFEGCMLIAWTGGSYPQGAQAKISWEAPDGTFLSALATSVLDAADPAAFLSLGWTIGEALDHQHVPTVIFAHWPGQSCEFAELLSIVARRTPALGSWELADDYFANTDQPYHQERLTPAAFRYNWLVDGIAAGTSGGGKSVSDATAAPALLRAAQIQFRLASRCRGLQNLLNLVWQLEQFHQLGSIAASPKAAQLVDSEAGRDASGSAARELAAGAETPASDVPLEPVYHALDMRNWAQQLSELTDRVDQLLDQPHQAPSQESTLVAAIDALRTEAMERLSKQLLKAQATKGPASSGTSEDSQGRLFFNPRSAPLRIATHTLPQQHFTSQESWYFSEGRVGEGLVTCIDIPSTGFVVAPMHRGGNSSAAKQKPLADAGLLNNEFLEAQIDTARGHLRSLHVPAKRGNRLSLMIARRDLLPNKSQGAPAAPHYSEMVASDVRMLTSSNICGVIRSVGHLEMEGKRVAKFEIVYEVWRGSRIVEVNIRLSELAPLASANPWQSAYVIRLAWPTDAAILRTHAAGNRQTWTGGRAVSSSLIEIDEVDYRTHYLPAGLPFHCRTESRFLETILAVQGDQQIESRIGVAVDLPHPTLAAEQFVDMPYELTLQRPTPIPASSGWLATVDLRSVTVDLEAPLVDAAGQLVGVRLFITELDGKSSSAKVRLLREIESAARVDYLGGKIGKLTTDGDRLTIALRAHEQVNVDVLWKR